MSSPESGASMRVGTRRPNNPSVVGATQGLAGTAAGVESRSVRASCSAPRLSAGRTPVNAATPRRSPTVTGA
eukprot:15446527-Alexandrium_andersonii.AAC.1